MTNKEIIGIIMELNPFHNGHKYLIDIIKKKYPNSSIITIISGFFTMRGEISILSKDDKVKNLLKNNVDLVVELPIHKTLNSAKMFAEESITILKKIGITHLAFGIENGNLDEFNEIIKLTNNQNIDSELKVLTKSLGLKAAFNKIINDYLGDKYAKLIETPNNLLAYEYLKVLKQENIIPLLIKRIGNDDNNLKINNEFPSGSALRLAFKNGDTINSFIPYNQNILNLIDNNKLNDIIKTLLLKKEYIKNQYQTKEGIENYILNNIEKHIDKEIQIKNFANKKYTESRIRREILKYLMDLKYIDDNSVRILGFNTKGLEFLKELNCNIFSSLKDASEIYYNNEYKSATLYSILTNKDYIKSEFLYPIKENI